MFSLSFGETLNVKLVTYTSGAQWTWWCQLPVSILVSKWKRKRDLKTRQNSNCLNRNFSTSCLQPLRPSFLPAGVPFLLPEGAQGLSLSRAMLTPRGRWARPGRGGGQPYPSLVEFYRQQTILSSVLAHLCVCCRPFSGSHLCILSFFFFIWHLNFQAVFYLLKHRLPSLPLIVNEKAHIYTQLPFLLEGGQSYHITNCQLAGDKLNTILDSTWILIKSLCKEVQTTSIKWIYLAARNI